MKKAAAVFGLIVLGVALASCGTAAAEREEMPDPAKSAPVLEETESDVAFGAPVTVMDLGEDPTEAWEVTVAAPEDRTAEVIAYHDGTTGYEDEYPSDPSHQVVNVTLTRLADYPAAPADDLTFALVINGVEEPLGPVTFTEGPRYRMLPPMHEGATIEYPLVFTVQNGKVGAVAMTTPTETVYFD